MLQLTLEALRVNKGLTQIEASKELGVSLSTLQAWERGVRYPKQPQIKKLCQLYQVSYDNIFFG